MTLHQAIAEVREGHAQRIASPGQWVVWRQGCVIKHEMKGPR